MDSHKLIQYANNYLSGGGMGARSVEHAAELWEAMRARRDIQEREGGREMEICGHNVNVGDYIEVAYTKGETFKGRVIRGHVTGLWDENSEDIEIINPEGFRQVQLDAFWCFHDRDKILKHIKGGKEGEVEKSPLEDAQYRAGMAAFKVWQAMPSPKPLYTDWYYEVRNQSLRDALEGEQVDHNNERGKEG